MGVDSGAYQTVMVFHVMCVIIGFGGVFLNGVYGAESKRRRGPEGLAVFEATERVGRIAEFFILAVPVFGIALVLMSHHQWKFSQAWVSASLTIYVAALIVSFGFHLPNLRRMGGLMHELVSMSAPACPRPSAGTSRCRSRPAHPRRRWNSSGAAGWRAYTAAP